MNHTQFKESEMPFDTLAKFGLTQEMVEDLPQEILNGIYNGRRSPVLPIFIVDDNGNTIKARTRFALIRKEDGSADALFYPQLQKNELADYTEEERKVLNQRQAIIKMQTDANGVETQMFVQLDPGTNQILSVPTPVIGRNLQIVRDQWSLTNAEMSCLQKGVPITIVDGDYLITVDIDLTSPFGLRLVEGDEKKWREEQIRSMEKFNFGLYGAWVVDDEGNLNYVAEEDYTEEMLAEQKKKLSQRSAMAMK